MTKKSPEFWNAEDNIASTVSSSILWPVSKLYRMGARLRQTFSQHTQVDVPVICVGNVVVGGAGKTPVCIEIANILMAAGHKVHLCSKGYGGEQTEAPVRVTKKHTAKDVGDEPLLLARIAPTWVAKKRAEGLLAASEGRPEAIVMDDGMQNPTVVKDYSIAVVDGGYGFGNKKILPAGPLREPIPTFLDQINLLIIIGADEYNVGMLVSLRHNIPILRAEIALTLPNKLKSAPLLPFAGIGRPEKFFDSVKKACKNSDGARVVSSMSFPDHHQYTSVDLEKLKRQAKQFNAQLVTTEKDFVRLSAEQQKDITPLPMQLNWLDDGALILKQSLLNAVKEHVAAV